MMEIYKARARWFKVFMHPARLAILDILRYGEECVCHMEAILGLRQAYISQQLMVLRDAGLVEDQRDGWNIFYRVTRPEVFAVIDAMNEFAGIENAAGRNTTRVVSSACPCPKCRQVYEAKVPTQSLCCETMGK